MSRHEVPARNPPAHKIIVGAFDRTDWHPWFAWRPVRTITRRWRWLRTLERRCSPYPLQCALYREIMDA